MLIRLCFASKNYQSDRPDDVVYFIEPLVEGSLGLQELVRMRVRGMFIPRTALAYAFTNSVLYSAASS